MMKKFVKYSPNKISQKDVDLELIKSRDEIARQNQSINYYHGNIDRNVAEKLLKETYFSYDEISINHPLDGLFLIRKCSVSPDDFSLSMISKGTCFHYRINHSIDAYYVLDDGPLIHGLDELVKHYQFDPHGLPCRLNLKFVPSKLILPSNSRVIGNTNPLHSAVACVSEVNKVKMILKSPIGIRPDVNEKDDNGRTALHIACEYDNINAVEELIEANALTNIRAKDGSTPLHTAAEFGSIQCLEYLLKYQKANPMERNMSNNWVPLHEAASRDHYTCVNALLNYGLPDKPRTSDNQTPLDLAIEAGHKKTAQILSKVYYLKPETLELLLIKILKGSYIPSEPRIKTGEFLHDSSVTREIAKQMLDNYRSNNQDGNNCGVYLVRRTLRGDNIYVLSLLFNDEFFNYEICAKDLINTTTNNNNNTNSNLKFYFIDDGPYFRSLSHLVEHYTKYEDGLPGLLTKPIHPPAPIPTQRNLMTNQLKPSNSNNQNGNKLSNAPTNLLNPTISNSNQTLMNISNHLAIQPPILSNSSNSISSSNQQSTFNSHSKSDALNKANLFKSRTLLNDQKRKTATNSSKKLSKISLSEIYLQAIIGEGEFGTVYKGTYNGKQVAVKKLKDCTASNDFLREADIMGTLNNPCILKIFGLVQDKSCLMMVQELMIGSILEKLWQSPQDVTENHLKLWSSQIALGMQHMEEQKIVHRDLAARNVLLASMSQIKISDFGLSRSTDAFTNAYTQKTEGKIPIKWYAPESIEHLKFTSKSDVWSYGVTLWEMFSYGDQPYGNMNGSEVYMFIQASNRLQKPHSCPKNTYNVMLECWNWFEDKRPTFKELNQIFQNDSDYQKTLPVLRAFR